MKPTTLQDYQTFFLKHDGFKLYENFKGKLQ